MIALKHATTGEIQFVTSAVGYGSQWQLHGPAVPDGPDTSAFVLVAGAWVADPAKVETTLVAAVKAEAERRRMLVMSPGGAKKAVYALKQAEIEAWSALASDLVTSLAAFLALSLPTQKRRFRFAIADAAARGEPDPAAAIARFSTGAEAANLEVARIEAIEQMAVSSIKAASTAAVKRAAFAAIDWSLQLG